MSENVQGNADDGSIVHVSSPFSSAHGRFTLHVFADGGKEDVALTVGDPASHPSPPVRMQSSCLTATAFSAELCDCRQQLELGLRTIAEEGCGIVVYLAQEGRGHGLVNKVRELALMTGEGMDTVDAAAAIGIAPDLRDYTSARRILDTLLGEGHPVVAMTNNPTKVDGLREAGVNVVRRRQHEVAPTAGNRSYLEVKRGRMGHLLEMVGDGSVGASDPVEGEQLAPPAVQGAAVVGDGPAAHDPADHGARADRPRMVRDA